MATKEGLEPLMAAVDGLDVQVSPDTLASGLVDRLMTDTHCGGAGRITGAAVSDQQGVLIKNWLQNRLQMSGRHRRQHGADGHTGTVGGHQDRNVPLRQTPFGRFAAAPAGLAIEVPFAFTTAQDKRLVGLDDTARFDRAPVQRPSSQPAGSGDASDKPCCRPPRSAPPRPSPCRHRLTIPRIPSSNPCVAAERAASRSRR